MRSDRVLVAAIVSLAAGHAYAEEFGVFSSSLAPANVPPALVSDSFSISMPSLPQLFAGQGPSTLSWDVGRPSSPRLPPMTSIATPQPTVSATELVLPATGMNELRWSGSTPVIAPKIAPVTFTDAALMGTALPGLSSGTPALKWQVTQPAGLYRAW